MRGAWTDEADAELRRLQADGLTASQIAQAMHKSKGAISGRLWRLGIYPMAKPVRTPPKPEPAHNPHPAPPTSNHPWKRQAAAEVTTPCTDDTRMYDLAPEAGGVLWLCMEADGCLWPMNEVKPIHEHRRCGAPAVKSGLPGWPYCATHSRTALKQRAVA